MIADTSNLYSTLTRFGSYYPLKLTFNVNSIIEELNNNFNWVQYNPRKNIDREGLSITSLDGGMTGRPDLDSLHEYYKKTGIDLDEPDFNTKTPVYPLFSKWLDPFEKYLGRTHVIRLNSGGYFPPHRDNKMSSIPSFRLFLPLNYGNGRYFLLEDSKMHFENGKMYFIDTAKMHTLFNANETPFYFVVANVILSEESVAKTLNFLYG
jgi:hypothetical protein|tara:strand:- start:4113 stop:4736 length:624 start_codon:yes stop_codon:yes gene_type:complete